MLKPTLSLIVSRMEPQAMIISSGKNIQFNGVPFKTTVSDLAAKLGKPDCFNINVVGDLEIKAIGYKETRFGSEDTAIYYFANNLFFLGEYLISDINVKKTDIRAISHQVLAEFEVVDKQPDGHYYIKGSNETSLYFGDNGFSLFIRYFDETNKLIDKYIEENK